MISAQEARDYEIPFTQEDEKQLEIIEKSILEALSKQQESVWFYQDIRLLVILELKRLGYVVSNHTNQKDGATYKISWQIGEGK